MAAEFTLNPIERMDPTMAKTKTPKMPTLQAGGPRKRRYTKITPRYQTMLKAMYRELGTWAAVEKACGVGPGTCSNWRKVLACRSPEYLDKIELAHIRIFGSEPARQAAKQAKATARKATPTPLADKLAGRIGEAFSSALSGLDQAHKPDEILRDGMAKTEGAVNDLGVSLASLHRKFDAILMALGENPQDYA